MTLDFDHGFQQLRSEGRTCAAASRPDIHGELCGFHEQDFQPVQARVTEGSRIPALRLLRDCLVNVAKSQKELRRTAANGFEELAPRSDRVRILRPLCTPETHLLGRL